METHDLTLAEAADAVGLHVETLRRLARAGQIETYIVNPGSRRPHFRVTPAALQAFRRHGRRKVPTDKSNATPSAEAEMPIFLRGLPAQALSGAEIIALWERDGIFDAFAERATHIGPGKRFADSTEYVQYLREQSARYPNE